MRKLENTEYTNRVYDLVGKEYSILEEYINTETKLLTRHNLCGFEWKISPNKFRMGRRCPRCGRKNTANLQRKTVEILETQICNFNNGEFSVINVSHYKNAKSYIDVFHNTCQREFSIRASNFLTRKTCPLCSKEKESSLRKTDEEFKIEIEKIYCGEYTILGEYKTVKDRVLAKHICGHEWMVLPSNLLQGFGCPICASKRKSKGEASIHKYLLLNKINFEIQKRFSDCVGIGKGKLSFDFCILDEIGNTKLLIEYQGNQHSAPISFFGGTDRLIYTQIHDAYKKYWCNKHDIPLLCIDYKEYNKIEEILASNLEVFLERR